jgi:excisionase family DNA binding protein/PAS domain S-box-containing protein
MLSEKRDKLLLTVKDVAAYLQVNQTTIYRLLRQAEIPAFKLGGDWRFNLESIDEWRLAASAKPTFRTQAPSGSTSLARTRSEPASVAAAQIAPPSLMDTPQLTSALARLHQAMSSLMEPLAELRALIPTLQRIAGKVADSDPTAETNDEKIPRFSFGPETVLAGAPIAFGLVDRHRRMVSYNDAFCELFEYSREQLRARDFFDLMCEDDRAGYATILAKLLSGEPEAGSLVGRALTRKGHSILVKIHVWGVPRKKPPRPDYVAAVLQRVATSNEAMAILAPADGQAPKRRERVSSRD